MVKPINLYAELRKNAKKKFWKRFLQANEKFSLWKNYRKWEKNIEISNLWQLGKEKAIF